jgi:DNA-binding MarR family transcriptional regulator
MDAIFFGLKRAYHGTLRIARRAVNQTGLTAARFDMLYALLLAEGGTLYQSELRERLGVSRPTVSRMLGSLETLGYVERMRCQDDMRQRLVKLTLRGRMCIRRARRALMTSGLIALAVDSALSPKKKWFDAMHVLARRERLQAFLNDIRDAFRDQATLAYLWHPDG